MPTGEDLWPIDFDSEQIEAFSRMTKLIAEGTFASVGAATIYKLFTETVNLIIEKPVTAFMFFAILPGLLYLADYSAEKSENEKIITIVNFSITVLALIKSMILYHEFRHLNETNPQTLAQFLNLDSEPFAPYARLFKDLTVECKSLSHSGPNETTGELLQEIKNVSNALVAAEKHRQLHPEDAKCTFDELIDTLSLSLTQCKTGRAGLQVFTAKEYRTLVEEHSEEVSDSTNPFDNLTHEEKYYIQAIYRLKMAREILQSRAD